MSTRAIGSALGVSVGTVVGDRQAGVANATPADEVIDAELVDVHLTSVPEGAEPVTRMALTAGQLAGWDCIRCGTTQVPELPFVPVGWVAGHGQVFVCAGAR